MKKRQSKTYLNKLKTASLKQKINILKYNLTHNEEYSPFPLYAKIEINGQCNLDCVMCYRTSLPHRDKIMTLSQFKTILDHVPTLIQWSPHGYNEPLLHPRFFDFVEEAHDRDIGLVLVTNATLLDAVKAKELSHYKVDRVIVSIDAVGKRYEEIRRKANYDVVRRNILNLTKIMYGIAPVSLAATVWGDNFDQILKLVRFAEEMSVPISFGDITWTYEYQESRKDQSLRENLPPNMLEKIKNDFKDNPLVKFGITKKGIRQRSCTLPWSSIYVDVVGDVFPCTDNMDYKCGNVLVSPIKDIFNNELYKKFRVGSLYGHEERYNCLNCAAWGPIS